MNTKELIEAVKKERRIPFQDCNDCEYGTHNGEVIEKLKCLAELEDKIEQGTLIELPCKVGDTVYFAVDNGWDCAEIDEIHIFKNDIVFEWVQYDRGYELTELWDSGDFSIRDIGKTVFLTREEAEKALEDA